MNKKNIKRNKLTQTEVFKRLGYINRDRLTKLYFFRWFLLYRIKFNRNKFSKKSIVCTKMTPINLNKSNFLVYLFLNYLIRQFSVNQSYSFIPNFRIYNYTYNSTLLNLNAFNKKWISFFCIKNELYIIKKFNLELNFLKSKQSKLRRKLFFEGKHNLYNNYIKISQILKFFFFTKTGYSNNFIPLHLKILYSLIILKKYNTKILRETKFIQIKSSNHQLNNRLLQFYNLFRLNVVKHKKFNIFSKKLLNFFFFRFKLDQKKIIKFFFKKFNNLVFDKINISSKKIIKIEKLSKKILKREYIFLKKR